jgi:hypothetical protein
LEGAKDASISFQVSGKPTPDVNRKRWGGDIQLAYAPINHLAFTYSYSNRKERDVNTDTSYGYFNNYNAKYTHNVHEFGVGFFHTPNRNFTHLSYNKLSYLSPLWVCSIFNNTKVGFSLFGGFGFGSLHLNDNGLINPNTTYNRFLDDRYTKLFFQPSIHFFKSEYFSFSFITKFSRLYFNKVQTNYSTDELSALKLDAFQTNAFEISELFFNLTYKIPDVEWLQLQINLGNAWSGNNSSNVRGTTGSVAVYVNPFKMFGTKSNSTLNSKHQQQSSTK